MTHFEEGLFWQTWTPAGPVRGVVVIVHGFCEHAGRYARLAEELHRQGFAVHAGDLRGHGKSAGARIAIRRFDDYLDDAQRLVERARQQHPGRPVFLLGHSMGGAIVLWLAISRQPPIDGLIACAPAVSVGDRVFPVLRRLAGVCSLLAPWLRLFRVGGRRISRDPAVVADFRADPLVFHGRFPVRTAAEILRVGAQIQRRAQSLTLPVLLLHGTDDMVTDPLGSRLVYDRAKSADRTLHLYPGLYHDLFHEPEHGQVTADVLAWLAQRCDRHPCRS
jgi:alpha-beta hydrolase superfamily lysophospholipase